MSSTNALLLGCVYSKEYEPKRGQEFRDRVRCEALERHGYNVYTLDNKHEDTSIPQHCTANFTDARRMFKAMETRWSSIKFDEIILDYFFSPVGWARTRWTESLFERTFPLFALSGILAKGGKIWLPNLDCIQKSIHDFKETLDQYYHIRLEQNPRNNPLFLATEDVEQELLRCPDSLTNETQMRPLFKFSNSPFYCLEVKDEFDVTPKTPTKVKSRSKRPVVVMESSPETEEKVLSGRKRVRTIEVRENIIDEFSI